MTASVENRRKELRMSQAKIAKRIGISRQYYNAIENSRSTPSVKLAKDLALILQVDWTIFFNKEVNE